MQVAECDGEEDTVDANRRAFRRWRVVPRMLRDVAQRGLSVEVTGLGLPTPLLLAPIGMQSLCHERAAVAAAAVDRAGVLERGR